MFRGQGRRHACLIIVRSLTNLAVSELLGVVDFIRIGGGDVLHDPTVPGSLDFMSLKQFPFPFRARQMN